MDCPAIELSIVVVGLLAFTPRYGAFAPLFKNSSAILTHNPLYDVIFSELATILATVLLYVPLYTLMLFVPFVACAFDVLLKYHCQI